MSFSNDNLLILGDLAPTASYPIYTRMTTPLSLPAHYVEFLTTSIQSPKPPLAPHLSSLYVSINTPLYFSEYPTPAPLDPAKFASMPIAIRQNQPSTNPTGLELYDGTPMTVEKETGTGSPCGLSATAKDGTAFSLSLSASSGQATGRGGGLAPWVFCRAALSVGGAPQFSMSMGLSPEDLLTTFSLTHDNITSAIGVDLAPATGVGGYAKVTRAITYYGETVSKVLVNMPDGSISPLAIATSPLHQFVSMTDLMSAPLATVLSEVAGQTQTDPLTALGSLDVQFQETQSTYVNRGMALTGPACARLGLLFSGVPIPGFADLAQWLGWSMASIGAPYLRAVLTQTYTDFEAWRAKQGVGLKPDPYRSILSGDVAQSVTDAVFDQAWKH